MTPDDWRARLRRSPELLPIDIDPQSDTVSLLPLDGVAYEKASFLDARLDRPASIMARFAEVEAAAAGLPVACDFIFHIGHVGSTLLSRLLGTHADVFGLREPQALRTLAGEARPGGVWSDPEWRRRLAAFLALYSRTWTPEQRVLVKATSLVSEIADPIMDIVADARALMMIVRPETYLATILGGPNSRVELAMAAPARRARLAAREPAARLRLDELSEGELAAMSWACEASALSRAAAAHPERTRWIDFDRFLAEPRRGIEHALEHLYGAADPQAVDRLAASAYFGRYSKAPEYAYGPQVRHEVLASARREWDAEIRRGLAWLETAAAAAPSVAGALETAERLARD